MLSGEDMQRRKTVKNNNRSNQQKQLCTCRTLFCTFLKLPETSQLHVLWKKCHTCSRSLFFTAAYLHLALVAATKFSCCSSNKKMSPLFFISRSRPLSPFNSLSFAGLPPTFSFSLSFSFSIFQICGHDNQFKLNINTSENTDTGTISAFRFRLY